MIYTKSMVISLSMKLLCGLLETVLPAPIGYAGFRVIHHEPDEPMSQVYQDFRDAVLSQETTFTSADFPRFDMNCARVYLCRLADRGEIVDTKERRKSPTGNNKRLIVYKLAEITGP